MNEQDQWEEAERALDAALAEMERRVDAMTAAFGEWEKVREARRAMAQSYKTRQEAFARSIGGQNALLERLRAMK